MGFYGLYTTYITYIRAVGTFVSRFIKEAGVLTLSWYKTNEKNAMLEYLKQKELKLWV